jgi:hypothetical protein
MMRTCDFGVFHPEAFLEDIGRDEKRVVNAFIRDLHSRILYKCITDFQEKHLLFFIHPTPHCTE